jgi:predicted dehydrogenase
MNAPRIAVIGTGWWSTEFHIPSLAGYSGADLTALVDLDCERLERTTQRFACSHEFTSVEEFIAADVADGVVIATPSGTHYEVASQCLKAGLHVMLEKPMTIQPEHAWELTRLAQTQGLHLTIGFTFQHTLAAEILHQEIGSGQIGDIISVSGLFTSMVEAYYRGTPEDYKEVFQWGINGPMSGTYSSKESAGGGQAATQLSHAFGMVIHSCARPIRQIFAFMDYQDLPVDLADAVTYEFWNGGIGTMCSTGNMRPREPHQQEFRYYGSKGYALQDLVAGTVFIQRKDGSTLEISGDKAGDPYPAQAPARHLADLISGRTTRNKAPAIEGAWVTDAIAAAYRSASSGMIEQVTKNPS